MDITTQILLGILLIGFVFYCFENYKGYKELQRLEDNEERAREHLHEIRQKLDQSKKKTKNDQT